MNEIDLYKSGKSIPEVSTLTGIPRSTLRFRLLKAGALRSRKRGIKMAAKEGRLGTGMLGKKRVFTPQHKAKISKSRLGTGKGYRINSSGYKEYTSGEHKGRSEHVVFMESVIRRRLFANECVHHIDENRTNNHPTNLQLMTKSEHASLHAKQNSPNRKRDTRGRYK